MVFNYLKTIHFLVGKLGNLGRQYLAQALQLNAENEDAIP